MPCFGADGRRVLLRPQFVDKMVDNAVQKGSRVYVPTNGRLMRPEVIDRLADAGVAQTLTGAIRRIMVRAEHFVSGSERRARRTPTVASRDCRCARPNPASSRQRPIAI